MLRAICTAFFLMFAGSAMAVDSVEAPGKIFYKMPSGEIVKRQAALVVPARGEGDVVLKVGDHEKVAHHFFSTHKNGRVIFYVVFVRDHELEEGYAKVFRGTYLRGTNKAIYYGDIFKVRSEGHRNDELVNELEDSMEEGDEHPHHDATYLGGFKFKALISE